MTLGTAELSPPLRLDAEPRRGITKRPIRQRYALRCGPVTLSLFARALGQARPPPLLQVKLMSLRSRAAETDATKRALATFGNPFGLALYDRDLAGVRKAKPHRDQRRRSRTMGASLSKRLFRGKSRQRRDFVDALTQTMSDASDIECLVRRVGAEHRHTPGRASILERQSGRSCQSWCTTSRCAIALVKSSRNGTAAHEAGQSDQRLVARS